MEVSLTQTVPGLQTYLWRSRPDTPACKKLAPFCHEYEPIAKGMGLHLSDALTCRGFYEENWELMGQNWMEERW